MKSEEIVNKETQEVLINKAGEPLVKNTLELGDKFISLYNAPVSEKRGQAKFERYFTKAKVQTVKGEDVECFLELTPTQYETLLKVVEDEQSDDLNQYVFTTYEYANAFGKSIGITNKVKKAPAEFN